MTTHIASRRGPKPNPLIKETLIKAGLNILHTEGYAAAGVQSIVENAGVPKGTFYNHFSSKELFSADVIDEYFALSEKRLISFLNKTDQHARARLASYFDDRIQALAAGGLLRGCLIGNLTAEVADHSELIREKLAEHMNSWSQYFADCIRAAQSAGEMRNTTDAQVLGRFILNGWEGALLRMRADKSIEPLLEFKMIIFGSLLV